jgi:hypothetical protein
MVAAVGVVEMEDNLVVRMVALVPLVIAVEAMAMAVEAVRVAEEAGVVIMATRETKV